MSQHSICTSPWCDCIECTAYWETVAVLDEVKEKERVGLV